jgi:Domain of unknown function (DUF222)
MFVNMEECVVATVRDRLVADLDERLAVVCGELNAAHARLAALVGEALAGELWDGEGIRTPEHWLAWKTGLSPARAAQLVAIARRRGDLPVTMAAFTDGELAIDQVVAVATRTPAWADAEMCQLARHATVTQLRRVVGHYPFDPPHDVSPTSPESPPAPVPAREVERCSFGVGDDGRFWIHAEGDADGGAIVDAALSEARDRLFHDGQTEVTWWDALIEVAHRSLDTVGDPGRRDRFRTYLHLDVERVDHTGFTAGAALPDAIRRYLTCDGTMQPVWERDNTPIGVGHASRVIPPHTRRMVRHRDRGCRVPGCGARRWLDVHHISHWEDHGPTETWNLVSLCAHHHRLHHRGQLGITGNADDPDGLAFTNRHGLPIRAGPLPTPPSGPPTPPRHRYHHPAGEPLDTWAIHFNPPHVA